MASDVYANGRELSCKAGSGKTMAAFPDVCWTPPQTPATPTGVPVPYPNNGMAGDTTSGSKTVQVGSKEVMLRNKSYFSKSTGDEAGSAPNKGLMTSTNRGKVYFCSWSMDVKFEGENVVRHLDTTTHNHSSDIGNEAAPWPHVVRQNPAGSPKKPCEESCPKEPDQARKDKVRSASPDDAAKKSVNSATPKKCAACGGSPASLAADHIVPVSMMFKMPGFACLSEADQKKIANTPSNFVGLCKSCNSSKCDKLWHTWLEHKKKGLKWDAAVREPARKITNDLLVNIKKAVRDAPCA